MDKGNLIIGLISAIAGVVSAIIAVRTYRANAARKRSRVAGEAAVHGDPIEAQNFHGHGRQHSAVAAFYLDYFVTPQGMFLQGSTAALSLIGVVMNVAQGSGGRWFFLAHAIVCVLFVWVTATDVVAYWEIEDLVWVWSAVIIGATAFSVFLLIP